MSVTPNQAILFHRASMNAHTQSMSHNFATLHDIKTDENNHLVIMEGQLMSHDGIMSVLTDMAGMKQKKSLQVLPYNIIAQSDDSLVWHVPGNMRYMLFKNGKKTTKIVVPYPSLIFKVIDNTLSVVATKYKRTPKADDVIYHAPLMNIYSDSRVCVGSADCPDNADTKSMAGWESVIFDTIFTHTNHNYTLYQERDERTSTNELYSFYKSITTETLFPKSYLNTMSELTLAEWVEL